MKSPFISFITGLLLFALIGCAGDESRPRTAAITSLSQFDETGRKIGVPTGAKAEMACKERFPQAELLQYGSVSDGFIAVKTGKIDGFCYTDNIMRYVANNNPDLALIDEAVDKNDLAIGVKLGNAALMTEINDVIKIFHDNGLRAEMEARWLKGAEPEPAMPIIEPAANPTRTVTVGVANDHQPMAYLDAAGRPVGFDAEYARRLCKELNVEVNFITMEWGALIPSLQSERVDFIISSLNITEERRQSMLLSDVYVTTDIVMMVREDPSDKFRTARGDIVSKSPSFTESLKTGIERNLIREDRWKLILGGLSVSLIIAIFAFTLATLLGFGVCGLRMSGNRFLNAAGRLYITVLRGTPIVVLLMIVFYVIFAKSGIDGITVAIIAFGANGAAFIGEIIRSAILTVDKGQIEAARSMGFGGIGAFFTVTFPQAARVAFPVYMSEFISMFRMTSVVGYIAIVDLTKAGDIIRSRTYDAFFPLIFVALVYLITSTVTVWLFGKIERLTNKRLRRHRQGVAAISPRGSGDVAKG